VLFKRIALISVALVVISALTWILLGAATVGIATLNTRSTATTLTQSDLISQPSTALAATVSFQSATGELVSATDSAAWKIIEKVPFIGGTAQAVSQLGIQLDAVSVSAVPLVEALSTEGPLLSRIARTVAMNDSLKEISSGLAGSLVAMQSLTGQTLIRPIVTLLREVTAQLSYVQERTEDLVLAEPHLSGMLGNSEKRTWLVILGTRADEVGQESAIKAYATASVTSGKITVESSGIWPNQRSISMDSFSEPDARRLIEEAPVSEQLDGVLLFDQTTLKVLLADKGPGTLDARKIDQYLQGEPAQEGWLPQLLAEALFHTANEPTEFSALVSGLRESVNSGSVKVWSSRGPEQLWLQSVGVGN
jgi:hypothetical protein